MLDSHHPENDVENRGFIAKSAIVSVKCPANVEIEGKIDHIQLKRINKWKMTAFIISCILTGGMLYLFSVWFIKLKIWLTLSDSELNQANRIIVYGADKTIEIQEIKKQSVNDEDMLVFYYRLFKYIYYSNVNNFLPAEFHIDGMTYSQIHRKFAQGLTDEEYHRAASYYDENSTNIPTKSILQLLFEEVLSPFYIFQVFSIIIWWIDEYEIYSGIIIFLSSISITTTLYETRQTTMKLKKMAEFKSQVFVYRGQNFENKRKINSCELVPGDIIEVPEGEIMPCDAILLNGTCIMNEAMLTGESIPVTKSSLPDSNDSIYKAGEEKSCTLFAGTMCIQVRFFKDRTVFALVTRTGFTTVKGELIRTMLFPKASNFKFYYDSFMFIGILGIMAIIGFFIDLPFLLNSDDTSVAIIIIKCLEIVTVTVPPALPTCMSVGINVAIISLKRHNIFCISPNKINEAGKVNIMCFDKTGTLTEEGLDMEGVRTVFFNKNTRKFGFEKMINECQTLGDVPENKNELLEDYIQKEYQYKPNKKSIFETTKLLPNEYMAEIMATCHSLTTIIDRKTQEEKLIGDPLDLKMYEACGWNLEENLNEQYDSIVLAAVRPPRAERGSLEEIAIIRRFEFQSRLQRMSVVARKMDEQVFRLHVKGSPEAIRELCIPESVPENFHNVLSKYTEDGKRVLAVGTKVLGQNYSQIMAANQIDLEQNLIFIGFLIMENKLKPITTKIINDLHKANIRTVMVTGDNVLTAISVARQCNMVKPEQRIFLGDIQENQDHTKTIVWKNFEFSPDKLDDSTMEPTGEAPRSSIKGGIKPREIEEAPQDMRDLNVGVMDLDPLVDIQDEHVIAITGKAFSLLLHEIDKGSQKHSHIFRLMLDKAVVFARMHPDEKALMIKHMQTYKRNIVGMCGDGANDCGALKTANVGISLSEAEASVAAPFTSKRQDIGCVVILLRYGRAALSTSFQCFKYMALYSIIQFTTLTLVYAFQVDLSNFNYYYIDIIIILPVSFTMAFSDAYKKLTIYQPTGRLISFPILTSVIGQSIIQIMSQVATIIIVLKEPWYNDNKCDQEMTAYEEPCIENCSLFLVSIFQYVFVALAFMVGKPFRKPFYTNFWFTICVILLTVLNLIILFDPFDWSWLYPAETGNPDDDPFTMVLTKKIKQFNLQYTLFVIIVINTITTMIWERVIVKYSSIKWKEFKKSRKSAQNEEIKK